VLFIYKIISVHLESEKLSAVLTVLIIALQPKLNLISVSGMETTMFIFLIAGTLYFYKKPNKILLGLFLGLTIWCRPDGFVLWLAILIDYFILQYSVTKNDFAANVKRFDKNDFMIAFGIGVFLLIIYFSFNYFLSGSILPNTYKAKLEYYQNNLRENFLKDDVLIYFSSAEFIAIVFPFLVALIFIVLNTVKRRYDHFLVYLLFTIGLIAVYYIQLPFAHRFGRYLIPVIPFYVLISVYGIRQILNLLLQKTKSSVLGNLIFILFFGITAFLSVIHLRKSTDEFAELSKYHNERHVAAGLWIKNNTAENSIIAVHDIGAIGYYGNCKLVDMVGLVTPELIQHLNDKNFSLFIKDYLSKNKVTHIAALKNWFEIVNDNPVYVPINKFEILEIYKFNPEQTHIQPRETSYLNEQAIQFAQRNDLASSIRYLQQSLSLDPASSKTNFLIGAVYEAAKDNASAETYFRKTLTIFPNYLEANFGLARILNAQGKFEEAKKHLQKCAEINPNYQPTKELLQRINQQEKSK
jgi:tetratricopeptide (TPR) repeat protein